MIRTQGDVRVFIHGIPVHFQVVDNDFPDSLQFRKGETLSCTSSSHDLPPRTKVLISVPTSSTNASGYVRRDRCGPGLFVGEALVSQKNGLATLYAINTTAEHVVLTIPSIE